MIRYLKSVVPAIFARDSFQRASTRISNPILVNSIPKSGTNLLLNIVLAIADTAHASDVGGAMACHEPLERLKLVKQGLTGLEAGQVCTGHVPHSDEIAMWLDAHKVKHLFIYRDPRDIAVSVYHYITRDVEPRHAYYPLYERLSTDGERLMAAIQGIGEGRHRYFLSTRSNPNIGINCRIFLPWLKCPNTFSLRYEDLVSTDRNTSLRVMKNMLHFLGIKLPKSAIAEIYDTGRDPSISRTFRRGQSGSWTSEFSENHIAAFKEVADDVLKQFGYGWND